MPSSQTHGHEVAEMVACFDADWKHEEFRPHPGSTLIWCPNNGRQRVAAFIDAAKHTLWLQNERYQDQVIIERLVRAARRGVKIHILSKKPHSLKPDKLIEGVGGLRILQDVGVKVHALKGLKLHAKMLKADSKHAIIGSINLAPGSFDARRKLAIETDDPVAVKRLEEIVEQGLGQLTPARPERRSLAGRPEETRPRSAPACLAGRPASTGATTITAITTREVRWQEPRKAWQQGSRRPKAPRRPSPSGCNIHRIHSRVLSFFHWSQLSSIRKTDGRSDFHLHPTRCRRPGPHPDRLCRTRPTRA